MHRAPATWARKDGFELTEEGRGPLPKGLRESSGAGGLAASLLALGASLRCTISVRGSMATLCTWGRPSWPGKRSVFAHAGLARFHPELKVWHLPPDLSQARCWPLQGHLQLSPSVQVLWGQDSGSGKHFWENRVSIKITRPHALEADAGFRPALPSFGRAFISLRNGVTLVAAPTGHGEVRLVMCLVQGMAL